MTDTIRVVALSGGIGGARLALGLYRILSHDALMVVCNTGDDFRHMGLHISPDVDTMLYTLGGIANPEQGWGRAGETWTFMQVLEQIGGESWFSLGDGDLALHVQRTHRLDGGETLSSIIDSFGRGLHLHARVVPMCDVAVPTMVKTATGTMAFQHYFVRERCAPSVHGFEFRGIHRAAPCNAFWQGLFSDALEAVVICPSNPFISIDPILAVPGIRKALRASEVPVIAVSPVVGGQAVKGPTAKMMTELGLEVTAGTVADRYRDVIDGFVLDEKDRHMATALGVPCAVTDTLMVNERVKRDLATTVMDFARELRSARR